MKTLLSLAGGALTVTEEAGVIAVNFDESLGSGEAKGVVSGKGSIQLNAAQGVQLGEKLLNAHLPTSMQAVVQIIEGVANNALKALE